ncbi:glycosyl transferase family 2 [Paraphotobacterium marinum]|uniref:Glycosyl transferase family 2 n=1 Tax=Paraphotobacterium marinum TaxID=1755811 RepID=A0A220VGB5_9GAMM|nr:glycosyltransferase family 2 protein [Paraphotobacterium marinum]ASK79290.1 glycosyl transferase family 2 [Paraphotobacterium marinum]
MNEISLYILTYNSEQYLSKILDKLKNVVDEILIVDSGSSDSTQQIVERYKNTRFIFNKFENFKQQRMFAEKNCKFDMILFLDSDELPCDQLVESIRNIKKSGFEHHAYRIARYWNVLQKDVRAIYPICSPDHPIKLYNRKFCSFKNSALNHASPSGYLSQSIVKGKLSHFTFETKKILKNKVEHYSDMDAKELIRKGKKSNNLKIIFNPVGAFVKWYLIKGGYKDGITGIHLGKYAYDYTKKKYLKAKNYRKNFHTHK